jgi:hypothetical protein
VGTSIKGRYLGCASASVAEDRLLSATLAAVALLIRNGARLGRPSWLSFQFLHVAHACQPVAATSYAAVLLVLSACAAPVTLSLRIAFCGSGIAAVTLALIRTEVASRSKCQSRENSTIASLRTAR